MSSKIHCSDHRSKFIMHSTVLLHWKPILFDNVSLGTSLLDSIKLIGSCAVRHFSVLLKEELVLQRAKCSFLNELLNESFIWKSFEKGILENSREIQKAVGQSYRKVICKFGKEVKLGKLIKICWLVSSISSAAQMDSAYPLCFLSNSVEAEQC